MHALRHWPAWTGLVIAGCGLLLPLAAEEPAPLPPAVTPQPAPAPAGPGPLAEAPPTARHTPPRKPEARPQPAPELLPDEPDAPLDDDLEQGPRHPLPGTVKLTIKRDGVEVTLEAPAAMFADDELKDLLANYLPKPDRNGLGVRVYNLRKRGIETPFEVLERLARKAAKGADEEQAELIFHFDEANRVVIVSAWEALLLDRVDLVIDALSKEEPSAIRGFGPGMMGPGGPGMPPGGPGWMPGGAREPGGPGGAGGPGGRGEAPAQGRPQPEGNLDGQGMGGAAGADGEMQRRKQMEQEQFQKRQEKERRKDDRRQPEGGNQNKGETPPPAGPNEQF